MTITSDEIAAALQELGRIEPAFAHALERVGPPQPRVALRGQAGLLRIIIGQQVSVASARAIFARFEALVGDLSDSERLLAIPDESLRAVGLSRQKIAHVRSLAAHVASGALDVAALPRDDEAAITRLVAVKGVGRWTAEIYLMIAEARPDVFPAGDLAVRAGLALLLGLADRPGEAAARALAERWRPHRSAATLMAWHVYSAPPL